MWCGVSDESLIVMCACHVCVHVCVDMCVLGRVSECDVCLSCITARVCGCLGVKGCHKEEQQRSGTGGKRCKTYAYEGILQFLRRAAGLRK